LSCHLDDWQALNQIKVKLLQDRSRLMNLLFQLGFTVNKKKPCLMCSDICSSGRSFRYDQRCSNADTRNINESKTCSHEHIESKNTAKDFMILLGMINCFDLIPNARFFMRLIKLH